jgi:hypothetical protein
MGTIHILPTDKPSRLHTDSREFFLTPKYQIGKEINSIVESRNIYITSDEEIKEGDWFVHSSHGITNIYKAKSVVPESIITTCDNGCWVQYCKKIILTTDQDLIKDGVQAIDDESLEWFVQNSSCEEVKVELHVGSLRRSDSKNTYKIIIPKEEPKQENDYTALLQPVGTKQETLEEACKRIKNELDYSEFDYTSFKLGAKWQQEQDKKMYSEEEVDKLLDTLLKNNMCSVAGDELIKEFKNK